MSSQNDVHHFTVVMIVHTCSQIRVYLGIEFYSFVSHVAKLFSKFTRGSSVFHTSMRNKQIEFNPYIYTLSKLSRFGYEISVFKYTTGLYSEQQPAHTSWQQLHGKMDVKIFLMFIVAENTGSVNIIKERTFMPWHAVNLCYPDCWLE